MIVAVVAHEKDAELDYDAGRKFVSTIKMEDLDLDYLADQSCVDEQEWFDENDNPDEEKIRAFIMDQLDEFIDAFDGRSVACFHVRDLVIHVAGGMSWGDVPEPANAFWFVDSIPGLLPAMGFVADWTQPDPTVTPEEEAAALQSIARAKS
jgi:hypothetical protein